ncbi:hypothetical protein WJX81_002303 [Elliptochloris bilobata]|uniref:Reticulon-like protein n=1 Tax=Elliptochloris bilobata TaxID=381761 RepID=A0AAW1QM39_9CHLO
MPPVFGVHASAASSLSPPATVQGSEKLFLDTPEHFANPAGGRAIKPAVTFETAEPAAVYKIACFRNVALSSLVFLLGSLAVLAGEFILRGKHNWTLLTATSYIVLLDLALNFARSVVSARWRDRAAWSGSEAVLAAAHAGRAAVLAAAAQHDRLLTSRDPVQTVWVAAAVWAASVLGSMFSLWRLMVVAFYSTFAVSVCCEHYSEPILQLITSAVDPVKARWEALGLSRNAKGGVLAAALLVLLASSGWATRMVMLLLAALIVRCHLEQAEVDAIATRAQPMVLSAKKRARRVSDFVRRRSSLCVPLGKLHEG